MRHGQKQSSGFAGPQKNVDTPSGPLHQFNQWEVAALINGANDTGDKVYALLVAIRGMLPLDSEGEPDDPCLATLVQMAIDEMADVSYQAHCRDRLAPGLLS